MGIVDAIKYPNPGWDWNAALIDCSLPTWKVEEMTQVNTFGGVGVTVYSLAPGDKQTWVSFGGSFADFGRVFTFAAEPINPSPDGEVLVEVINVDYEISPDGTRRVFFTVHNASQYYCNYRVFYTYTDIIYY